MPFKNKEMPNLWKCKYKFNIMDYNYKKNHMT